MDDTHGDSRAHTNYYRTEHDDLSVSTTVVAAAWHNDRTLHGDRTARDPEI